VSVIRSVLPHASSIYERLPIGIDVIFSAGEHCRRPWTPSSTGPDVELRQAGFKIGAAATRGVGAQP